MYMYTRVRALRILFEEAFISFGAPDCAATIRGRRLIEEIGYTNG